MKTGTCARCAFAVSKDYCQDWYPSRIGRCKNIRDLVVGKRHQHTTNVQTQNAQNTVSLSQPVEIGSIKNAVPLNGSASSPIVHLAHAASDDERSIDFARSSSTLMSSSSNVPSDSLTIPDLPPV